MSKKRKDDEITRLEKQIRELKSTNRSLLKYIKKLDRHYKEEDIEVDEEENEPVYQAENCPDCYKGSLVVVRLAGREFKRCSLCHYRSKAQKL